MTNAQKQALQIALNWHLENGADEVLADEAIDRTVMPELVKQVPDETHHVQSKAMPVPPVEAQASMPIGAAEARVEAQKLAAQCESLDQLKEAIAAFDGLAVKKTATNMVFSDGKPGAPVMLIGEAPGADEDRQGKPFVGVSGQLLDRILKWIDLDRSAEDPANGVYISNILNWRPPGNRTPSPAEMDICLPFIEKHIALAQPKILILCGGVSAKSLLQRSEGISKLRGVLHEYRPVTPGVADGATPIPALATYHPAYLLRTPAQKKAVWADMLMLQKVLRNSN